METRFILKHLLLPPGSLLLLALLGWYLYAQTTRKRLAGGCIGLALAGIWLLSTPFFVEHLARWLEPSQALEQPWQHLPEQAQAIVVLGAGRELGDPAWMADQPSSLAVERLRYAARLQRATHLPLLVTGGAVHGPGDTEAQVMAQVLEQDFAVPVRWQEDQALNTWQNAQFSAELLREAGVQRVLLVTHAAHMPRARWCFEQAGVEVIEAPLGFLSAPQHRPWAGLLPEARSLWQSLQLLNEVAGQLVYPLRYAP